MLLLRRNFLTRSAGYSICLQGMALFLTATTANAGTYDPDNVVPSDLMSGIYSIKMHQTGTIPVVRVQSDGTTYTTPKPGQQVSWQGTARGVCRSKRKIRVMKWWLNDNTQHHPASYHSHHVKFVSKTWISSKSSTDKHEVAGTLSLPLPDTVGQHAVKACNDYLQAELNKGKSKKTVLSSEHLIDSDQLEYPKLAAATYLQCSESNGMNTKRAHAWQNARVNYLCEGFNFPEPVTPPSLNLSMPFILEKPKVKVEPANYTGTCPIDLEVEGTLKANKSAKVKYRWSVNGALGPVATATLNTSGWKTVMTVLDDIGKPSNGFGKGFAAKAPKPPAQPSFQINATPDNVHQGYVELKSLPIDETNWNKAKISHKAHYKVTCKTKPAQAKLALPGGGLKKSDLVPGKTLTIGNITANWGSTLIIDASVQGGRKRGHACELRMAYDVKNKGTGAAGVFHSRLFEEGSTLHQGSINSLAPTASKKVSGTIYLPNGTHIVGVFVDNQTKVSESNEQNNKQRITVKVTNCSERPVREKSLRETTPREKPSTRPGRPPA